MITLNDDDSESFVDGLKDTKMPEPLWQWESWS